MTTREEVAAALRASTVAAQAAVNAAALAQTAAVTATIAAGDAEEAFAGYKPEPVPEPPPTPGDVKLGLYPGADMQKATSTVLAFEASTGTNVEKVGANQDQRYEAASSSIYGVFGATDGPNQLCTQHGFHDITCAIQLAFTGGPYGDTVGTEPGAVKRAALQATVDGKNDDIYVRALARMKASPWPNIVLRFGSEGDIPFPPHSFVPGTEVNAKGNDDLYKKAWARVAKLFKDGLGTRVRFSYTTTMFASKQTMVCADGKVRTEIEAGYPGADLVDIVGVDSYFGQPLAEVQSYVAATRAFATKVGKPMAFDEWGITPGGRKRAVAEQRAYMTWMGQFCRDSKNGILYASYFAGWADSKWEDLDPTVQQAFIDAWT